MSSLLRKRNRRSRSAARRLLRMAIIGAVTLAAHSAGSSVARAGDESVDAQTAQLDDAIGAIDAEVGELENRILETRRRAGDADRRRVEAASQLERIENERDELQAELKKRDEAAARDKDDSAKKKDNDKKEKPKAKEGKQDEAEKEKEGESEPDKFADQSSEQLQQRLKELADEAVSPAKAVEEAQTEVLVLSREIASLEKQIAKLSEQRNSHREEIESVLREADRWVSFTAEVAPIFHARCVACHNVRNAQGRYSMANHAAILSPGESGDAVVPGDAEASLLFQLVEDGTMPYDADPLEADEVETIRRWIDTGARLETAASPDAPLIRLMPRTRHPDPPERYPIAIPITAVAASPDETIVVAGYHELLVRSRDGELLQRISDIAERTHGLALHPDGRRLAAATGTPGRIGEIKLLDVREGKTAGDLWISEDSFHAVAFSPDGSRLAAAGADGSIVIFDLDGDRPPRLIEDHSDWVNSVAWSPDGKLLVSAGRDKTCKVFDAETGRLRITFNGHGANAFQADFSADAKRVASCGEDRKLRIWNVADAKQVHDVGGLSGETTGLARWGERRLISAGVDGKLRVHSASDGKVEREHTVGGGIRSLAAVSESKDEAVVLIGDNVGRVHRVRLSKKEIESSELPAGLPTAQ